MQSWHSPRLPLRRGGPSALSYRSSGTCACTMTSIMKCPIAFLGNSRLRRVSGRCTAGLSTAPAVVCLVSRWLVHCRARQDPNGTQHKYITKPRKHLSTNRLSVCPFGLAHAHPHLLWLTQHDLGWSLYLCTCRHPSACCALLEHLHILKRESSGSSQPVLAKRCQRCLSCQIAQGKHKGPRAPSHPAAARRQPSGLLEAPGRHLPLYPLSSCVSRHRSAT
jgi:hypothetical protein